MKVRNLLIIGLAVGMHPAATTTAPLNPTPQDIMVDGVDCNAAWDALPDEVGKANAHVTHRYRSLLKDTNKDGPRRYVRTGKVAWSYNLAESSTTLWVPQWPKMSAADRAAVKAYRSALLVHENGHHSRTRSFVLKAGETISGAGATSEEAESDFETKLETHVVKTLKNLKTFAVDDYDVKTDHGRKQSNAGGRDVALKCPQGEGHIALPREWEQVFPNSTSSAKDATGSSPGVNGDDNVRAGLAALTSTEEGQTLMATGNKDFVQGACAARVALRATDGLSDRYVVAGNLRGGAAGVLWPMRSPQDQDALLKATSSYRETMRAVKIPPDLDDEDRGLFLAASLASLWHEIARAREGLNQSDPNWARGIKAFIAAQEGNPSSVYSCFHERQGVG